MKKIFAYILCVAAAFSMQSCLHDDEEVFSESASVRLGNTVADTKTLLESAENGWLFHYYTGEEYSYGGYTFLVKFKNGKAHVSGDIAPAGMVTSSSYDVVKDQGPVLTFNTYNEIMHYLAQPYQNPVDGEQGDFEFLIMKTEQDRILLTGKKWKNRMVLERLPENVNWEAYLTQVQTLNECLLYNYELMVGGERKGKVAFDARNRRAVFQVGNESYDTPYSLTDNGFVLPDPVRIGGMDVNEFHTTDDALTLTGTSGQVELKAVFNPEYVADKIGASISTNYDEHVKTYPLYHGEQYTFTTDADWVSVDYADNELQLTIEENVDRVPRQGSVVISSEAGEAVIAVSQFECDFDQDVAGSYLIGYWDASGEIAFTQAVIGRKADGTPAMNFALGKYVMSTNLAWNDKTFTLTWMSGQHLGTYGNYQVFNIYYTNAYWSGIYDDVPLEAPISFDEEGSIFAEFSGSIADEEINAVYLMACTQAPLASTDNILGYLEVMQYPMLLKMDDAEEVKQAEMKLKSNMAAKRLMRPMAKPRLKPVKK